MDNEYLKQIGARLTELRGVRTQAEYAPLIGVLKSTLSIYENGHKPPHPDVLIKLAQQGVDLNWLLTGVPLHKKGEGPCHNRVVFPVLTNRANKKTGKPVMTEENVVVCYSTFQFLGRSPYNGYAFRMNERVMEPLVKKGDLLCIDPGDTQVRLKEFYLLSMDGFLFLRRADLTNEGMRFRTIHTPDQYPSFSPDKVKVIGRAQSLTRFRE